MNFSFWPFVFKLRTISRFLPVCAPELDHLQAILFHLSTRQVLFNPTFAHLLWLRSPVTVRHVCSCVCAWGHNSTSFHFLRGEGSFWSGNSFKRSLGHPSHWVIGPGSVVHKANPMDCLLTLKSGFSVWCGGLFATRLVSNYCKVFVCTNIPVCK